MKTTVVYHSADFDGLFCREIARKFLPDTELIGWNFGDAPLPFPNGPVYVLDLPLDRPFGWTFPHPAPDLSEWIGIRDRIIWIDHHKSSIDSHPKDIPGYRIDGVAACRLAWQWFAGNHHGEGEHYGLPTKEDFVNRNMANVGVAEPLAVRLAGEYDVWDKRDPDAEAFQYGLRTCENSFDMLLSVDPSLQSETIQTVSIGKMVQRYQQKQDSNLVKYRSYRLNWEGLNFIVLNTGQFNSLTFAALDVPETGHDALIGYMFNGKCWTVSLYHAKHRTDLDLSKIAVKHGGGGHRGACGFTCKRLPFMS